MSSLVLTGLYIFFLSESGKDLAKRHGWEFRDLISCTPFGAIHRRRSCLLECVTERGKLFSLL